MKQQKNCYCNGRKKGITQNAMQSNQLCCETIIEHLPESNEYASKEFIMNMGNSQMNWESEEEGKKAEEKMEKPHARTINWNEFIELVASRFIRFGWFIIIIFFASSFSLTLIAQN